MGTRQYVGARYVPAFANPVQWDNRRTYEPLTMVTYLNNTYTSKKPVPQGVDINNAEYWVLTGNYNAQVEQYRQEVESLRRRVISVKDYGAVGDGATDDSNAFMNALIAAKGNTAVFIPDGTYVINTPIEVNYPCYIFSTRGKIKGGDVVFNVSANKAVFDSIEFDSGTAFMINANNTTITNCFFDKCETAIHYGTSFGCYITNCSFYNCKNGVYADNGGGQSNGIFISDCVFDSTARGCTGLNLISVEGVYCCNTEIIRMETGINIHPTANKAVKYVLLTNVLADLCYTNGISIVTDSNGAVNNITMCNSWSSTCNEYGIYIDNDGFLAGVSVVCCSVHNNNGGIYIKGAKGVLISGTQMYGNSKEESGKHDCIVLDMANQVNISDSIIGLDYGYTNKNRVGINIISGNDINIHDNTILDVTEVGIINNSPNIVYINRNIGAPMWHSNITPANSMYTDSPKSNYSGNNTPVVVKLPKEVISAVAFNGVFEHNAVKGSTGKVVVVFIPDVAMDNATLNFDVKYGYDLYGANYSTIEFNKSFTMNLTAGNVYALELGNITEVFGDGEFFCNVVRVGNSVDNYTGNVCVTSVIIKYLSL